MEKLGKNNRLRLHLTDLSRAEPCAANIWDPERGARLLHLCYRPDDRTFVLNDYLDLQWGAEMSFPVGDVDKIWVTVSLARGGAIQVESNLFDPFCFLSRVCVPREPILEYEHDADYAAIAQNLPDWRGAGHPLPCGTPAKPPLPAIGLDLVPSSKSVLIVGSAPSVLEHLDKIRAFEGDIWALNDSLFWLLEKGVSPTAIFVNDGRFLRKRAADLNAVKNLKIVTLETVDTSPIEAHHPDVCRLAVVGRTGFADAPGRVYHGCSVYITAIQCAAALKYRHIDIVGVMFPPPLHYTRIDATKSVPEYVFPHQIEASRLAMQTLRHKAVHLNVYEPDSNLNFF